MKLKDSGVIFDEAAHTYTLNGVSLQGVTGMIGKMLFPDKYNGIPQAVMEKAAEYGHDVHKIVETIDELGVTHDSPEGINYTKLKFEYGLVPVASEYTVTDGKNFASNIDKVYECEDGVTLVDVKTTYKLDTEYVRWQLSVYAYMFEMNNDIKVRSLAALWLRKDECKYAPVERVPDHIIKALMDYYLDWQQREDKTEVFKDTETYKSYMGVGTEVSAIPKEYLAMRDEIIEIETKSKEYKKKKDALASTLKGIMMENGVQSWDMGTLKISLSKASESTSFDMDAFKADHPDLYKKYYTKKTVKSPSITFKVIDK